MRVSVPGSGLFGHLDPAGALKVVLALDIDGTLVDVGDEPSLRVRKAIKSLADAGAMIVLATGRQLHGTAGVIASLGIGETWVVASNGAIVARYVGERRAMLGTQTFDPRALAAELAILDPDITLGCEEVGVGYLVNRRFGEIIPADHVQRVVQDFPDATTMFTAQSSLLDGRALADVATSMGLSAQGWDEFGVGLVDIAAAGLSKGGGVAALVRASAADAGVTVAAGDFHNDLELLEWADIAIAMGQAPDAVKAVATHVAPSIQEDGLAQVLEELLDALHDPPPPR